MDKQPYSPRPLAGWYWTGAVVSLLLTAAACAMYVVHITTNPATLPLDERTTFLAVPTWVVSAFGLGAVAGLAGALMLVLRRKLAQPLMLVSLLGMLAWLAGFLLVPGLRQTSSENDFAVVIAVVAVTWTIFWFARHSAQRGWLR